MMETSQATPGEPGRSRLAPAALAAVLALAALGLILVGPAPARRSPTDVRAGGADLHAASWSILLDVRVPFAGRFEPRLLGQAAGSREARFRVRRVGGSDFLRARILPGEVPSSVPLRRGSGRRATLDLRAGGFRVLVESDDPGARFDALQLISSAGGGTLSFEAEHGRTHSGGGLLFLSPAASGGALVGALAPPAAREEYVQQFRAEANGLDALRLAVRPWRGDGWVRFEIGEPGAGPVHFVERSRIADLARVGEVATLRFPALPASADRDYELRVTVEPGNALELVAGDPGGIAEGGLLHGAERLGSAIRFAPRYASPWRGWGLAGLLIAAGAVLLGLWGRPRWAIALLAPALVLPGYALFQRDYAWLHASHYMADNYDLYALRLQDLWIGGGAAALANLRAFALAYPHAHSPAVPAALALVLFDEPGVLRTYVALSAAAALAAIALLHRLARRATASESLAFIVVALGTTHFLFVRTVARTSTDMPGYLAVVVALWLGLRLLLDARPAPRDFAALVAVLTIGLFVRLSLLPVGPAIALAGLLRLNPDLGAGSLDTGPGPGVGLGDRLRILLQSPSFRGWLAVAVVPVVLFFGLNHAAGIGHSFTAVSRKALLFAEARTAPRFVACFLILAQALPLLALLHRPYVGGRMRFADWRPATLLGAVWTVAALAFLLLSGAPYWNRHFLYVLPGLLLLSLSALEGLLDRHPRILKLGVAALCLANLALAAFNILHELPLELAWAWYVLT